MIRLSVLAFGIVLVLGAALIAKRQRSYTDYGGVGAFAFHLFVVAGLGCALIVGVLSSAPLELIASLFIVLGLSDIVVGIWARRRQSRQHKDEGL
jgi:hypothetical protein